MRRRNFLLKVKANKEQKECLVRLHKLLAMRPSKQYVELVHVGRAIVFDNFFLGDDGEWKGRRVSLDRQGMLTHKEIPQ